MTLDIKKRKLVSFISLIFSSLGFTLGLLLIRFFSDHQSLVYIINLQSTVVFLSFILQFGLRAAIRQHIYRQRLRLANVSEKSLHYILALLSIVMFLIEYFYNEYFYFCLSSLLTLVTLKLTTNVAKNNVFSIIKFSGLNFFVAISGSCFILYFNSIEYANFSLECISLVAIILTIKIKDAALCLKHKVSICRIYCKAQSYQLGSSVIALFVFSLSQTAIIQFTVSDELSAYSDALIASGFLVLLLGKMLLLFEKKLYQDKAKHFYFFSLIVVAQVSFTAVFSLALSIIYNVNFLTSFVVVFILLSRIPVGYIVQYVNNNRFLLNILSSGAFLFYLAFYMFDFKNININYQIFPVVLYLAAGFLLFYKSKG